MKVHSSPFWMGSLLGRRAPNALHLAPGPPLPSHEHAREGPDPRTGPNQFFTADHRNCDALWAAVETAFDANDPEATTRALGVFDRALRLHLALEEELLFPALEDAMNMHGGGPTEVMRGEHVQMRAVLDTMARAAAGGDSEGALDHGDTLLMLIQQHNLKEEGILYPMAERAVGGAAWGPLGQQVEERYTRGLTP